MDYCIQSQLQSPLIQKLSEVPNNLKRFTGDIPDNAPFRSLEKAVVSPFMGDMDNPDATLNFRVPRLGYLNRMWLKVRLYMPQTPLRTHVDPDAITEEKPRGAEFFASFFESATLLVGGRVLETLFPENILYEVYKHTGPGADAVLYGLKGMHSDYSEDEMGELGFDAYVDGGAANLPKYANFMIPLNFSVCNFHKDALDTGFLQDIQIEFKKHAIRGMQHGETGSYTRVSLVCKYHNFHPHFKNQVRNANFQKEPSTLITNQNINFKQTPEIEEIPEVIGLGPINKVSYQSATEAEYRVSLVNDDDLETGSRIRMWHHIPLSGESVFPLLEGDFTVIKDGSKWLLQDTNFVPNQYPVKQIFSSETYVPGAVHFAYFQDSGNPLETGDTITLQNWYSGTNANGTWTVTKHSASQYTLDGSVHGTYEQPDWKWQEILISEEAKSTYTYSLDLDKFVTDILITFRKKDVTTPNAFVGDVQPTPSSKGSARFILKANDRVLYDKQHYEMGLHGMSGYSTDVQDMTRTDQNKRFFGLGDSPHTEFIRGQPHLPVEYGMSSHRNGDVMYRIPLSYISTDEFQSGGLDLTSLVNVKLIIEAEGLQSELTASDRKGLEPSIVLRCRSITRVDGRTGAMYVQE